MNVRALRAAEGAGQVRRAQQIVLAGKAQGTGATVKWSLQREGRKR